MDHNNVTYFEIEFDRKNYDIITANTAYYQFIGEEKYLSFDRVFTEDVREDFIAHLNPKLHHQCFLSKIHRMNVEYEVVACIRPTASPEYLSAQVLDLQYLFDTNSELSAKENEYLSILGQLGIKSFKYTPSENMMRIYSYDLQRKLVYERTLEETQDMFNTMISVQDLKYSAQLYYNLSNGTKSFTFTFHDIKRSKIPFHSRCKTEIATYTITGMAIYYRGIHMQTVGTIRELGQDSASTGYRLDPLTGLMLKEDITAIAQERIEQQKEFTAIAMIDIDDFKDVNDGFGHRMGDLVLQRCADIIHTSIAGHGYAGRIGGDEFMVVLCDTPDIEDLKSILRSIKNSIASAYTEETNGFHVSTSIGCASYPKDTNDYSSLFALADFLLYRAKDRGKNRYITYNPEKHGPVEEILKKGVESLGLTNHRGMGKGETICRIADYIYSGKEYSLEHICNDIVDVFGIERLIVYDYDETKVLLQCGDYFIPDDLMQQTISYIHHPKLLERYKDGVLISNNVINLVNWDESLYEALKTQGVLSFMHHKITGRSGKTILISYESAYLRTTWSEEDFYFYRVLDHLIQEII